jgi:hypothetical protein
MFKTVFHVPLAFDEIYFYSPKVKYCDGYSSASFILITASPSNPLRGKHFIFKPHQFGAYSLAYGEPIFKPANIYPARILYSLFKHYFIIAPLPEMQESDSPTLVRSVSTSYTHLHSPTTLAGTLLALAERLPIY